MKKKVKLGMIQNMINLNQKNTIDKIKNITIITSIVNLIIYACNLYYLHNLENCKCFKQLNIDKKINLHYLVILNYILLAILILSIINTINISTTQKGGSSLRIIIIPIIILLLLISIYSYYIYNIYEIYKKDATSKACDCLESNFKYSLYIHGALLSISVVMITIILIILLFY